MVKRLAPVLVLFALWVPVAANALGLGNITMNSALNEPLDAEIELLAVQSGDLDNLVVRMAAAEDFQRVGAERTVFLSRIDFSVERKANGAPYVKLSSVQAVTEPFLDFVVEARWPRGRILREFTVLVDPPVLSAESPAPVQQPQVAAPAPAAPATPRPSNEEFFQRATPGQPAQAARPRDAMAPVSRAPGDMVYGPVKYKDTLWTIANDMKPADATVNQMMVALVRNNPQAFYNGNANQLKAGYVLRVDNAADVTALSVAAADAEIERQGAEWQARRSGQLVQQASAPASGQVARGTGTAGTQSGAGTDDARLKLVAPGSAGAGSGTGTEDVAQLQQDLLLAAEALETSRQESEELRTRLTEMEEQMEAMQKLITLKDDEMALLQQQMAGGETPAATQPMAEGATPEGTPADAAMAPQAEQPVPAPAPAPMPAPEPMAEPGFMDELMGIVDDPLSILEKPMFMYGGIGILALILLGVVVARRRRMQDGFEESILNVGNARADAAESTMSGMSSMGESSMVSDFAMSEMSGMSGIQADASDVDPVSEADVYLAYGRHSQAEDILKEALKTHPDRQELKLKLLEVYFAAKNREAFEQTAQDLHDSLGNESDPLWAKAVTMGAQLCPGSDLFGGASAESLKKELAGGDSDEDLLDFEFDFDTDLGGKKSSGKVSTGDADTDEMFAAIDSLGETGNANDLDFDFDTETETKPKAKPAAVPPKRGSNVDVAESGLDFDVSSLDFNLDGDEAGRKVAAADQTSEIDLDMGDEVASVTNPDLDLSINDDSLDIGEDDGLDFDDNEDTQAIDLDATKLGKPEVADSGVDEHALDMDLDMGELSLDDSEDTPTNDRTQMLNASGLDFDKGKNANVLELESELDMDELSLDDADDTELSLDDDDAGQPSVASRDDDLSELEDLDDDVFGEVDEVGTKLDLARAYVDMGDSDGARGILNEVIEEGDDNQKSQAKELLEQIG